jgi:hypothetical protein
MHLVFCVCVRFLCFSESELLVFETASIDLVNQVLQAVVKRLHSETDKLNRLDAISGDGDTGTAFARAADTIAKDLTNGKLVLDRPSSLFRRLGLIAESRMGGTCGASKHHTSDTFNIDYRIRQIRSYRSII